MRAPFGMRAILLSSVLLAGACGGGSAAPADAGSTLDAPACAEAVSLKWNRIALISQGLVSSTGEGGGALTMTARNVPPPICQAPEPDCPPEVIELTQGGALEDEFDATLTFDGFTGAGPGIAAGFRMILGSSPVDAFIRQADTPVLEIFLPDMPMASMPTSAVSGSFRVVRHSGVVTVTASAGDSSVEIASAMPDLGGPSGGLAEIGLYNRGDTVIDGESWIRFTDFTINGSTQIESDTFDCN